MSTPEQLLPTPYIDQYINKPVIDQTDHPIIPYSLNDHWGSRYVSSVIVTEEFQINRTISCSTSFTADNLLNINKVFKVLTNAIKSLKLTQDYNGTYIAYLSGQLTDDEFLNESDKFSYSPYSELNIDTINDIKILIEATQLEFSPSEIAEIFKLDYELSVDAIKQLNIPIVER